MWHHVKTVITFFLFEDQARLSFLNGKKLTGSIVPEGQLHRERLNQFP